MQHEGRGTKNLTGLPQKEAQLSVVSHSRAAILTGVLLGTAGWITATNALDQLPAEMSTGIGWARAGGAAYVTDHMPRVLGRPAGTSSNGHVTTGADSRLGVGSWLPSGE
ncbi:hypothetical protein [Streptomyces stelliscabiei]|uniref:hypothetical protein n=1 Tax=Streptomyces stelliscabiei TaxID=146820 RepID=UPI002FEF1AB6